MAHFSIHTSWLIFWLFISVSQVLFHFLQILFISFTFRNWFIFSCDFRNWQSPEDFLGLQFTGIIAVKTAVMIAILPGRCLPDFLPTFRFVLLSIPRFNFSSHLWGSLWFCRIICTFSDTLLSMFAEPYDKPFLWLIYAKVTFFLLDLDFLRMSSSIYIQLFVPLVPLWHRFCSSGNTPWYSSE